MSAKILIVDDSKFARNMLRAPLEKAGYEVILAAAPTEAMSAALLQRPDLVISDLKMPTLRDGLDFLRMMLKEGLAMPVMIYTADSNAKKEVGALGFKKIDYLSKPTAPDVLKSKVARLLG